MTFLSRPGKAQREKAWKAILRYQEKGNIQNQGERMGTAVRSNVGRTGGIYQVIEQGEVEFRLTEDVSIEGVPGCKTRPLRADLCCLKEGCTVISRMQTYLTSSKQRSDLADDILVQQARSGDHGAFEALVDRYSALLLQLICHLMQDEHLAHDVLQYVFLQLYRSLPTLRAGGTLKAWLSQVARHRCLDELRRKRPVYFSEIAPEP